MGCELDHLFICASIGGPEAAHLETHGFTEGASNTHPGQGTACRRFFFANAYLELLWVNDPAEAQSERIRPAHLWERWSGRTSGGNPFGVGFRPAAHGNGDVPFPAWEYRPPYLPEPLSLLVGTNAAVLHEPLLFHLAFAQRPDCYPAGKRQPLVHPSGLREITQVEFVSPRAENRSPALQAVTRAGMIRVSAGTEHLLVIGFDGETRGKNADFRPSLPLILQW